MRNAAGKMVLIRLAGRRVATNLLKKKNVISLKGNKAKCNKTKACLYLDLG